MFFSKDNALTKEEVDKIVSYYKAFSVSKKTFAYINFLYKDNAKLEYKKQLDVSRTVYKNIFEDFDKWTFPFMNFAEEGDQQMSMLQSSAEWQYYKKLCRTSDERNFHIFRN